MKTTIALLAAFCFMVQSGNAAEKKTKLSTIFTYEMIGTQIPYLETITGPAMKVKGEVRTYKINGCFVDVESKSRKIRSLKLKVNNQCSFDLSAMIPNYRFSSPLNKMTFGVFNEHAEPGTFLQTA